MTGKYRVTGWAIDLAKGGRFEFDREVEEVGPVEAITKTIGQFQEEGHALLSISVHITERE